MCKKAPGRRCSGHLTESITSLRSNIEELAQTHAGKVEILQLNRAKDSNFDETERGEEMKRILAEETEKLNDMKDKLEISEAAFHLTEKGKEHLQSIIDNPESTDREKFIASAQLAAAKAQDRSDEQIIAISRDEDLDVLAKEDLIGIHREKAQQQYDDAVSRSEEAAKYANYHKELADKFREAGDKESALQHGQKAKTYREEKIMLDTKARQLKASINNIDRYLNRKEREEQKQEREAASEARRVEAEERRAAAEKARNRDQTLRKYERRMDKFVEMMVNRVVIDIL